MPGTQWSSITCFFFSFFRILKSSLSWTSSLGGVLPCLWHVLEHNVNEYSQRLLSTPTIFLKLNKLTSSLAVVMALAIQAFLPIPTSASTYTDSHTVPGYAHNWPPRIVLTLLLHLWLTLLCILLALKTTISFPQFPLFPSKNLFSLMVLVTKLMQMIPNSVFQPWSHLSGWTSLSECPAITSKSLFQKKIKIFPQTRFLI